MVIFSPLLRYGVVISGVLSRARVAGVERG